MNRLKIAALISKILLVLAGILFLATGLFAYQLGIDHDPSWGRGRIGLTVIGLMSLAGALALQFSNPIGRALARWPLWQAVFQPQSDSGSRRWTQTELHHGILAAGLGVLVTVVLALWYITCGAWTHWTPYSHYFDLLANAFHAGQLSLLEAPPPELLALENPYDYRNREGIGYLWDASLYQGKYYFYWGPVPALLAAAAKSVVPGVIEDQELIFFFYVGLMVCGALTLALLRKQYFPEAPGASLFGLILVMGLSAPVFWLINRPSVYETAIAGEQFFLMLGLYAALRGLSEVPTSRGGLLCAGFAWGAAVNCRLSAAPAVIFFAAVAAWVVYRKKKSVRQAFPTLLWFALPLMAWAVGLGWYNAARFGSPLETGHRYQLTGLALPGNYQAVTSLSYVIPSLYSYLVRPLQFSAHSFPFVFAPYIKESMWPFFIHLPKFYYYPEPLAGIFAAVPAVWLVFLPALSWLRRGWVWLHERPQPGSATGAPLWVWILLAGGVVLLLAPLLVFISTSMRYLADVLPITVLLAALGYWWGLRFFQNRPWLRRALRGAAFLLILTSVAFGLLVNFTNGDKRFQVNNPALYSAIAHFFEALF
jgi:hypothetical protein